MSQRDYYADLGVGADTSGDDLKKAYRKLAMQYHPDRNPGNPKAEDRFKEVNEAYDCLGDSRKRAAYDRMRTPPKPRVTPSGTSGGSRAHPSRPAWQGGSSAGGMPCRTATIRRLRSGTDIVLPISLEDAWAGGLMNVRIDAVVAIPGRVYVPPGVHDGERGIFRSGDGSAPVTFFVQRTRRFDRRSNDLHAVRSLTAERAARGTSLTIRCIDGRKRRATVPPGTRAGTILRLAGMGMPRRNGGGYGDMLIHISVAGPRHG